MRAGFAPPGGEGGPIRCGMCKLPDDVSIKLARKCARRLNSTSSPNTSGRDGTNTSSQSLSAGATIMSGMSVQQQLHSVGGPPPLPGLQGDYATAAAAAHAVAQAAHAHAARAAAASTTARPPNMILPEQLAASYSAMAYANPNSTIALSGIHQSPFHSAPTYHATTSAEGSVHGGHSFQSLRAGAPAFNALMKAAMEQSSQQQAMEHARLAATGMPISMRGGNPMFEGSVHTIEGSPLSTIMAAQQMNGALNGMPYGVVPSTIASLISPHSPVTQGALSAAAVGAAAANIELPVSVPVVCARAEDAAAAPKAPPRLSKRKARLLAAQVQHDEQATRHVGGAGEAPTRAPASPADHPETHRASYDVCIARAVAALPTLVELTLPFVRVGGALVASKGPYSSALVEVQDAHNAIAKLGGNPLEDVRVVPVDSFATSPSLGPPSPSAAFTAVVVSKSGPTPAAYPRRAGVPGKRPL